MGEWPRRIHRVCVSADRADRSIVSRDRAPDPAPDASRPFVLVVGAASRDVTLEDPRGWRLGGAVTYGTLTLVRFGVRVRALVGVDAEAANAEELDLLRDAGAEIALAPLGHGGDGLAT